MADIVNPGASSGLLNAAAMPQNQDLIFYKGDYVELFVTVKDSNGVPLDLTGSTPKAQLKKTYTDSAPVDFACTLTGVTGQIRMFLSSTVSGSLTPGDYIYDLQVTNSSNQTRTYLAGDVTVSPEVTT
jgi:hypothetical protein